MTILAIETAFAACQVAVRGADGALLAQRSEVMQRGQAEVLPAMLQAVMAEAGHSFAELALIAVGIGPGSFTGVRVGVAAARGLALVAGCPVAGVTTLEALAHAVPGGEGRAGQTVLAVVDARRGQVYAQGFTVAPRPIATGEPLVGDLAELGPQLAAGGVADWVAGDMAEPVAAAGWARRIVPGAILPAPQDLASIALLDLRRGTVRPAVPLYVRGPGAVPSRPGRTGP
ncbi:MAG: tRNA (adenosine(37)-N6)-threonylcarbamoyltransferase complex dimerization subunit type 1 TsaB [Sneathiellaceae bacterium]